MHVTPLRKSPDHGDWWIVKGMKSSHFLYNSDICRTTCVSGAEYQTPDSYIAVLSVILYKCQKFDVIGRGKCVSLRYRKSPDHSDWWNVLPTDRSYFRYMSDICRTTSVSGAHDQTPDSYVAVYDAKNMTSLDGEMDLTPLPEVARRRRLVECVAN